MRFVGRYVAFVAIVGAVAACSTLLPGNTPRPDSVSASPADSSGPTRSNAASTEPSIPPTIPNESATPNSASGYVDPGLAAQLAAKCQVAGAIDNYFAIPAGSTLQTVFPSAGKTPELDGVEGLFVAVYDGDVRILNYTGGGPPAPGSTPQLLFQNVVCVVPPAGEVEVYSDVSHEGMALPPGAHIGPPPTIAP